MLVLLSVNSLRSQIAWKISYIWCQHVNGLVLLPCLALVNQGEPCREWLVMHGKPPPPSPKAPQNSLSHPPFSCALFLGGGAAFRSANRQFSLQSLPIPPLHSCMQSKASFPLHSCPLHSSPLLWGKSKSQESTYREPGVFTSHKRDDISCERISVPRQG